MSSSMNNNDRYFSFTKIGIDKKFIESQEPLKGAPPPSRPNSIVEILSELNDTESSYQNDGCDQNKRTFVNNHEKVLVTQIYGQVSRLAALVENSKNQFEFVSKFDENNCRPLYYALKANNLNCVRYLLNLRSDYRRTTLNGDPAIHVAATFGCDIQILNYLLPFTSNLYETNQHGWTIFHCACSHGHLHLVRHLILKHFFKINYQDSLTSHTGLHLAAKNAHIKIVDFLLKFVQSKLHSFEFAYEPIDLNMPNNAGQNAFQVACKHGNYDVIKLMLEHLGSNLIDINFRDFRGYTSLDLVWSYLCDYSKSTILCTKLNSNEFENLILKFLHLLIGFASKFSSVNVLLFNIKNLQLEMNRKQSAADYRDSILMRKIDNYLKCLNILLLKCNFNSRFFLSKRTFSLKSKNHELPVTKEEVRYELRQNLSALLDYCQYSSTTMNVFSQHIQNLFKLIDLIE